MQATKYQACREVDQPHRERNACGKKGVAADKKTGALLKGHLLKEYRVETLENS